MKKINHTTVEFWRVGTEPGTTGASAGKAIQERAVLLHGMKESLGIEVTNWGDTDAKHPSEIVEIIITLTPVVVPALAILIKLCLKNRRLEKVRIVLPNGTRVEVGSGTPEQIASKLQSVEE